MKTRLFSSAEIIAALQRGGFEQARKSKGSHAAFKRRRPDGTHDVVIVTLDQKEVPRGTLDSILAQANISYEVFLNLAKVKRSS
jgi:predicted RNA binding protein YcfA (HicA-like mRNA interferase family)